MENVRPIYSLPEVRQKVFAVRQYIDTMLRQRNLFAWRYFIEDLKVDIELEIYKYEELHRQGKYKETGAGAYCNMALQGALNYAAMYSAQKRKANFECMSLDTVQENDRYTRPIEIEDKNNHDIEELELFLSIEQQCGAEIAAIVRKVYDGEVVGKDELKKCKLSPQLRKVMSGDFE